jgi:small multidrug resistance pump
MTNSKRLKSKKRLKMAPYVLLFFAIIAEVIATSALKLSHGFTKLLPSIVVIIGYSLTFWLMSLALKELPVAVVYAIWCGIGIVGMAIIGVVYFNEVFGGWHFLGTALIMAGVITLSVVTNTQ